MRTNISEKKKGRVEFQVNKEFNAPVAISIKSAADGANIVTDNIVQGRELGV